MNPDENNPLTTSGDSGTNSAFGSLDLNSANPSMPNASADLAIPQTDTTISPADNLASVESNLNSMSMGADFSASGSTGEMNNFGQEQSANSDAAPQFVAPDTPLTPAAPIPGSIGSAISAPASATLPVAENSTEPASPANTMFTPVTNMGSLPPTNAGANNLGVVTDATNANAHYNPFAQPNATDANAPQAEANLGSQVNASATSAVNSTPSSAQQPVFQPISATQATQTPVSAPSSTAAKTGQHGSKVNLVLMIALVITAIVAIVFVILYINASKNPNQTISVAPITDGEVVQTPIKEITCELTKEDGGNEVLTLNYLGDKLSQISISQNSFFDDEESALAERDILEAQRAASLNIAGLTEEPYDVSFVAEGNQVTATITASADQLRTEDADSLMLTTVDGNLDTSEDSIRANYEARGFVCSE